MDRRHKLLVSSTNVRSLRCLDRISRRLAMILAPSVQHKISIELQTLSQFTEASLNKGSCKIMRTKKPIDREIKWASLANKLQQLHRQNWPCNRSALSRTRQAARSSTKAAWMVTLRCKTSSQSTLTTRMESLWQLEVVLALSCRKVTQLRSVATLISTIWATMLVKRSKSSLWMRQPLQVASNSTHRIMGHRTLLVRLQLMRGMKRPKRDLTQQEARP